MEQTQPQVGNSEQKAQELKSKPVQLDKEAIKAIKDHKEKQIKSGEIVKK